MSDQSDNNKPADCKEYDRCLEYLNLMLDNEASEDQETFLKDHIEKCIVCFEQYEVEKQLRQLIKTKIHSQPVPTDLAQSIRTKVFQSA